MLEKFNTQPICTKQLRADKVIKVIEATNESTRLWPRNRYYIQLIELRQKLNFKTAVFRFIDVH